MSTLSRIIKDIYEKIKSFERAVIAAEGELFVVLVVLLSSTFLFGLVWWVKIEEARPRVVIYPATVSTSTPASAGRVVASKNGTKYYYSWCSGMKAIKEANRIWFGSEAEALRAGYTKAKNCQ